MAVTASRRHCLPDSKGLRCTILTGDAFQVLALRNTHAFQVLTLCMHFRHLHYACISGTCFTHVFHVHYIMHAFQVLALRMHFIVHCVRIITAAVAVVRNSVLIVISF